MFLGLNDLVHDGGQSICVLVRALDSYTRLDLTVDEILRSLPAGRSMRTVTRLL